MTEAPWRSEIIQYVSHEWDECGIPLTAASGSLWGRCPESGHQCREKGRDRDEGLPRSPGALNAVQPGSRRVALLARRYPFERSIKRDIC